MALRWYTLVVDCLDVRRQAAWWAEALEWTVIQESDRECVIVPAWADDTYVEQTPWDRVGPGMVFVPVSERARPARTGCTSTWPPTRPRTATRRSSAWSASEPDGSTSASPTTRAGRC